MTGTDRRALILGGAVILGAVLVLRVVPALVRRVVVVDTELHERAELLARARTDLGALDRLRDSAAMLSRAVVQLAPALVTGTSPADAAAAVAAELGLAASRHKLQIVATTPVDADTAIGRLRRVRLHAQIEGDVRGLADLVHALAGSNPLLVVRDLRVSAPTPARETHGPEVLTMEVTVEGWYLK
jgi:hypothetical protein